MANLTPTQYDVLAWLTGRPGPVVASQVAHAVGIDFDTANARLADLIDRGIVTRTTHPRAASTYEIAATPGPRARITRPACGVWIGDTILNWDGTAYMVVAHARPFSRWSNGGRDETRMIEFVGTGGESLMVQVTTPLLILLAP